MTGFAAIAEQLRRHLEGRPADETPDVDGKAASRTSPARVFTRSVRPASGGAHEPAGVAEGTIGVLRVTQDVRAQRRAAE